MKTFFRTLWGIWGALIFIVSVGLVSPFYFIVVKIWGKKADDALIWFAYKVVCRFLLFMMAVRVKVFGREKFENIGWKKGSTKVERACVVVSNHQSELDILANSVAGPINYKFLGKKEAAKIPFFGYIVNIISILIDRKSKQSKAAGVQAMKDSLTEGMSVIIYPEGTRNRTDQPLKSMYPGAFRLAIEAQAPMMVQTLVGAGKINNPHRLFDKCPGTIKAYWDGPIETTGMTMDQVEELEQQVRDIMLSHLA